MNSPYLEPYRLLEAASQALTQRLRQLLEAQTLTLTQFQVLEKLAGGAALSPTQCRQELDLSAAEMNGVLSQLQQKSLITRRRQQTDRRSISLGLSANGLRVYQVASLAVREGCKSMAREPLTELGALNTALKQLGTAIDAHRREVRAPRPLQATPSARALS